MDINIEDFQDNMKASGLIAKNERHWLTSIALLVNNPLPVDLAMAKENFLELHNEVVERLFLHLKYSVEQYLLLQDKFNKLNEIVDEVNDDIKYLIGSLDP